MDLSDIRVRYVLGLCSFRVYCDSDFLLSKHGIVLKMAAVDQYHLRRPGDFRWDPGKSLRLGYVTRNTASPDLPAWFIELEYLDADCFSPLLVKNINAALLENLNQNLKREGVKDIKVHFRVT